MDAAEGEEPQPHSLALQHAQSILGSGREPQEELLAAKLELERRSAELATSLSLLRATLEASTDAILVTDGSERITEFNARFLEMWQVPAEVLDSGEHHRFAEATSERYADPAAYLAR